MDFSLQEFEKYSDTRGDLVVFLKQQELPVASQTFGQIYFVTFTRRGEIRGEHYHKKWREWFGIVAGRVLVRLMDVHTKESEELILDATADKYVRLETGPFVIHSFKSLTEYAALINYADGEWAESDTIHHSLFNDSWSAHA